MKVVFLGTGEIGLPTLRWLLASKEHEVVAVVTQPDKPVGRKMVLTPPMVKVVAEAAGVRVFQPEKIRDFVETLRGLSAEVFVVVAYGQMLTQAVIDVPGVACLNLHASLLPRHRGASPIQAAILAGDKETGMTIMHVALGLDSGDVMLAERIAIAEDETGGSLHDKLAECGPVALEKALHLLATGKATRTPQDEKAMTHCRKLLREHGVIDWSQPAQEIARRVRAFDPWPGTTTRFSGADGESRTMKLFPPVEVVAAEGAPGTLLETGAGGLVVACGDQAVKFHSLQAEGKRRMTVAEWLAGNAPPVSFNLR